MVFRSVDGFDSVDKHGHQADYRMRQRRHQIIFSSRSPATITIRCVRVGTGPIPNRVWLWYKRAGPRLRNRNVEFTVSRNELIRNHMTGMGKLMRRWLLLLLLLNVTARADEPQPKVGEKLDRRGDEIVVCGQLYHTTTRSYSGPIRAASTLIGSSPGSLRSIAS